MACKPKKMAVGGLVPKKPKMDVTRTAIAKADTKKKIAKKADKFYEDSEKPYNKKNRKSSWNGGKVVKSQRNPLEMYDPKKYSMDDANDFDNSKAGRMMRTGELAKYVARDEAKKAAVSLNKSLTRKGR